MLADRVVSWKSAKQTFIDTFTIKAKLILLSCFETMSHCMSMEIENCGFNF